MGDNGEYESWTSMAKKQKLHAQGHLQRGQDLICEAPFLIFGKIPPCIWWFVSSPNAKVGNDGKTRWHQAHIC